MARIPEIKIKQNSNPATNLVIEMILGREIIAGLHADTFRQGGTTTIKLNDIISFDDDFGFDGTYSRNGNLILYSDLLEHPKAIPNEKGNPNHFKGIRLVIPYDINNVNLNFPHTQDPSGMIRVDKWKKIHEYLSDETLNTTLTIEGIRNHHRTEPSRRFPIKFEAWCSFYVENCKITANFDYLEWGTGKYLDSATGEVLPEILGCREVLIVDREIANYFIAELQPFRDAKKFPEDMLGVVENLTVESMPDEVNLVIIKHYKLIQSELNVLSLGEKKYNNFIDKYLTKQIAVGNARNFIGEALNTSGSELRKGINSVTSAFKDLSKGVAMITGTRSLGKSNYNEIFKNSGQNPPHFETNITWNVEGVSRDFDMADAMKIAIEASKNKGAEK